MEEGPEEGIYNHAEDLVCERSVMRPIHGTESENQIDGNGKEGNFPVLPSGQIMNPTEYDISIICCIGIKIGGNNDPALDNVPG